MTLESKNLIYRPITEADTDMVLGWRNSEPVRKYFLYRKDISRQDHLNWLNSKVASGIVIQFIVIIKTTDTPIGSVYLRNIDRINKTAEYGIFIGDVSARGKGYGSEIASRMVSYFFDELGYDELHLQVLSDNHQAIKSYQNAGFTVSGISSNIIDVNNNSIRAEVTYMSIDRNIYLAQKTS